VNTRLFNLLRYPISDVPTESELAALPGDLYRNWLIAAGFNLRSAPELKLRARYVSNYYEAISLARSPDGVQPILADVKLLREMISEYEPIQCNEVSN
jgi:hypothetical protein